MAEKSSLLLATAHQFLCEQKSLADVSLEYMQIRRPSYSTVFVALLRVDSARIPNFAEETIPRYNFDEFRQHFRLTRTAFETVLSYLQREVNNGQIKRGRQEISLEKELLVTLWYLGNIESIRSIADRFDLTKSSVFKCTRKICKVIVSHLTKKFIRWPTHSRDTFIEVSRGFSSMPGCIGCIDGSHIPIKAPEDDEGAYINRKGFHSIVLQCVCDHKRRFTDAFCGCTGRTHDATVLRSSPLFSEIVRNKENYFPENSYIIGDQAYPLEPWLMKKFPDRGCLSEEQRLFNKQLSSKRQLIEQSFGILKGRFRKLKMMDISITADIPEIVLAACTLHNICSEAEEDLDFFLDAVDLNAFDYDETNLMEERSAVETRNDIVSRLKQIHPGPE